MSASTKNNHQNKFIQLLSLSILLLGLGTSALLVQQKLHDSRAAVSAPPPPVCPSGQFFCGGCVNGCVNTGGQTCNQYIASHCQPTQTCQIGQKKCSGNTVQTCLPPGSWSNTQTCGSGQTCSNGNCVSSSGGSKTPTPQGTFYPKNPTPPTPTISKICTPNAERCQKVSLFGLDVVQKCRTDGTYWDNQERWCGDCSAYGLVPDGKSINNTPTCISPYSGNK